MWLDFFLNGVAIIAGEAIETSKKINELSKSDVRKIHELGRRTKTALVVLENLYKSPIINIKKVEEWTGLSRPQANELVKKLIEIGILEQKNKKVEYGREFCIK